MQAGIGLPPSDLAHLHRMAGCRPGQRLACLPRTARECWYWSCIPPVAAGCPLHRWLSTAEEGQVRAAGEGRVGRQGNRAVSSKDQPVSRTERVKKREPSFYSTRGTCRNCSKQPHRDSTQLSNTPTPGGEQPPPGLTIP